MNVSDIMVSPVVVTQQNKSIGHLRGLFTKKGINAIPVLSMEGEIEGIVTPSDISLESKDEKLVANVMTAKTHVVALSTSVKEAAKMMLKYNVHHLVAMDNGQVRGIISSMDFVKLAAED